MGFFIWSRTVNRATVGFKELWKATDFGSRVSNGFGKGFGPDWKGVAG